jgi:L-2,4-diaminobutyric acid acetyltransferase
LSLQPAKTAASMQIRPLTLSDGLPLFELVRRCPPLDVNTPYAYHLLAHHHGATCRVALHDHQLVGAVTGYRLPARPDVLFIWQIAVDAACRGQRLAGRMLDDLLRGQQPSTQPLTQIQTTIGPENHASRRLFERWAGAHGCLFSYQPFLTAEACGPGHDAEDLLCIDLPVGARPTAVSGFNLPVSKEGEMDDVNFH